MRLLEQHGKAIFEKAQQEWKNFYDELSSTGFAIDFAEDGSGIIGKYNDASGYYIDVGGSQLVIDGKFKLEPAKNVRSITADGLILDDDSTLNCDAIIYATGFGSMEEWVSRVVDEPTTNKIGQCWGYGSGYRVDPAPWEGELRNMWKPTAQSGLWFMGNLAQVRIYSRYLAMQLCERKEINNMKPYPNLETLKRISTQLRLHVVSIIAPSGQGYVQQGLSAADIFTALYFSEARLDPEDHFGRP